MATKRKVVKKKAVKGKTVKAKKAHIDKMIRGLKVSKKYL